MGKIINGKILSEKLKEETAEKAKKFREKHGIVPSLSIVRVGKDPASEIYVKSKLKSCKELGFEGKEYHLKESITEKELLKLIDELNNDKNVHGILVQLPLPEQIKDEKITESIKPEKDVDGFHPINLGKLMMKKANANILLPCTPKGIIRLIESTGIEIEGKNAVVIGRSAIVGKPVAMMLTNNNATVTLCHSKTKNLEMHTKNADILVVAVGKSKLIKKEHVKENAVVIDVGMNRHEGKLSGDVDFENVKEIAGSITPVPKGVGPMTVACLMENVLTAAEIQMNKN